MRVLWRVFAENFFSLKCAIYQPFLRIIIADNYSDNYSRCTSWIIFSNSFSITCTLFCKAVIFLSISDDLSNLDSATRIVCLLCQYHPSVTLLIESCAILRQSRLRLCKERYHARNFWAIHATHTVIRFLLQTYWSALRCQLSDVRRTRLVYNRQTGFRNSSIIDKISLIIVIRLTRGQSSNRKRSTILLES